MNDSDRDFPGFRTGMEVAVVGLALRFPRAHNIEEFWKNLENGIESICFFSNEELTAEGISRELLENPNYIKAHGTLGDISGFDAAFFGYTPMEATLMDPQLRFLHECAWEALEDAGSNPETEKELVGVYIGATENSSWKVRAVQGGISSGQSFTDGLLSNKDLYCGRISYLFNSRGPSLAVNCACSTSLVAIHLACRGLLGGECGIALAGGVSILAPAKHGYLYREGMIESRDGHCRSFDASACGTVFGSGIGLVVLKRLDDALESGNHIYAVIKGSAVNNDGSRKVGFTAPGVDGQSAVIESALHMSEVAADTLDYIETHGTATALGDSIEIKAMKRAIQRDINLKLPIGAVKTNLGHLDCAAGVAGFIKTVLVLKHALVPPTLHFTQPNPELELERTPFFINTQTLPLKKLPNRPLRAGVSSFGIGGTNAHIILEEAPSVKLKDESGNQPHLLVLSARTETALEQMTLNLRQYLTQHPGLRLEDVAYTLQKGRKAFASRKFLACSTISQAIDMLGNRENPLVRSLTAQPAHRHMPLVFMFPGQVSQYPGMGRELYQNQQVFRENLDLCLSLLQGLMKENVKDILYPPAGSKPSSRLFDTDMAQPVIFAFEYALARLLLHWGITPQALIGYSFGEYTAACISGVFSLEEALGLVVLRGRLMKQMPAGAMLSVPLGEKELKPLLPPGLAIAIINEPSCIVSGSPTAIDDFEKEMKQRRFMCVRLNATFAPHSSFMNQALGELEHYLKSMHLATPSIPFISGITGQWITTEQATNWSYWVSHLKDTIRFSQGIRKLLEGKPPIFIETGPGRDLAVMVNRYIEELGNNELRSPVIDLIPGAQKEENSLDYLLRKIGWLWLYHREINWDAFHGKQKPHLLPLPPYPFEEKTYWFETQMRKTPGGTEKQRGPLPRLNLDSWFYLPSWQRLPLTPTNTSWNENEVQKLLSPCLVFSRQEHDSELAVRRLTAGSVKTVVVQAGPGFKKHPDSSPLLYTLDPTRKEDYVALLEDLEAHNLLPRSIIHLWNVAEVENQTLTRESLDETLYQGYYSLLFLAQALGGQRILPDYTIRLLVVSSGLQEVLGHDQISPARALLLGPVLVIPREYPFIVCKSMDIETFNQDCAGKLIGELLDEGKARVIAYRSGYRWNQVYEPMPLPQPKDSTLGLKPGGVYLVTGGLGGIGFTLARHLAQRVKARLVLTARKPLVQQDIQVQQSVQQLENEGIEIMTASADVADEKQMDLVFQQVKERFGNLDGIIHAAGNIDFGGIIQERDGKKSEIALFAKLQGTIVLQSMIERYHMAPGFIMFCSSTAAILPPFGQVAYSAGNIFLDAYATYCSLLQRNADNGVAPCTTTRVLSINWSAWQEVGIAVSAVKRTGANPAEVLKDEMTRSEGVAVFDRILAASFPRVIVSPRPFDLLMEESRLPVSFPAPLTGNMEIKPGTQLRQHQRPNLETAYVAPTNEMERKMAETWAQFFGLDRVGIHDDFFELGGDSLRATILATKIHRDFNVRIQVAEMFKNSTLGAMAALVASSGQDIYSIVPVAEEREYYPVSPMQKQLYILGAIQGIGTAYHLTDVKTMRGQVDIQAMSRVFQQLMERHESLRTSFAMVGDEPVQFIQPRVFAQCGFHDMTHSTGQVESFIQDFIRPFDFAVAPLLRAELVKIQEDEFLLLFDMHHIISDGTSMTILVRDFQAFYLGETDQLPALRIQYKDYVMWQHSGQGRKLIDSQEAYWLERFKQPLPSVEMYTDFPRPLTQGFKGNNIPLIFDAGLRQSIHHLMESTRSTLYIILLAVYNILLSRLSGVEDVVIGTPVAGRGHADFENLLGIFINPLPMRNFPSRQKSFKEFLLEVKENTLAAYENQFYPFERLLEKIGIRRDISRNPLYEVELIVQNMEVTELELQKVSLSSRKITIDYTQMDISLQVMERGEKITGFLTYSTDLFKQETMETFLHHFLFILETVAEYQDIRIGEIRLPGLVGKVEPATSVHFDDEADFGF